MSLVTPSPPTVKFNSSPPFFPLKPPSLKKIAKIVFAIFASIASFFLIPPEAALLLLSSLGLIYTLSYTGSHPQSTHSANFPQSRTSGRGKKKHLPRKLF